jgi:hypothetical protein
MTTASAQRRDRFRHEALLYAGDEEFVEECAAFVADGVAEDEAVMVVAVEDRPVAHRLGPRPTRCTSRTCPQSVANPSRIIGGQRRRPSGRTVPAIGEPIGPQRRPRSSPSASGTRCRSTSRPRHDG